MYYFLLWIISVEQLKNLFQPSENMASTEEIPDLAEIEKKLLDSKAKFTEEFHQLQTSFRTQISALKDEIQELNNTHKKNLSEAAE